MVEDDRGSVKKVDIRSQNIHVRVTEMTLMPAVSMP